MLVMKKFIIAFLASVLMSFSAMAKDIATPKGFAKGAWRTEGAIQIANTSNGVAISDGILANDGNYENAEYTYTFRAPKSAKEVQAWVSFRVKDRQNRYTVGLRGGNNNILYMARYADDANSRFLGFAPLEFKPELDTWYTLRVVTVGKVIHVYLNDEKDPRLVIEDNTALWTKGGIGVGESYLPVEFSKAEVREIKDAAEIAKISKVSKPNQAYEPWKPSVDKEKLREANRAAYKPLVVESLNEGRTEISLDGQWLFAPTYELKNDEKPIWFDIDDSKWHTMNVPDMWVPPLAWLHGETGFPYLEEPARGKTAADKLRIAEIKKVLGYTFDWDKTKSAWYRHYIDLPKNAIGKHLELRFDAIATISKIYVNGNLAGSHVGMFGEVVCDVSKFVKEGRNVIAVEAIRELPKKSSGKTFEIAVTVEITEDMVNSLPKAFYNFSPAGIWQPAKLVITDEANIKDVFVKPALDGATFDVTLSNDSDSEKTVDLVYSISPKNVGKNASIWSTISSLWKSNELVGETFVESVKIAPRQTKLVSFTTPNVEPKLWTPADPNLYVADISVSENGKVSDKVSQTFGFRTVGVKDNHFMLNGNPFFLRGANHFPHAARSCDRALARRFIELSHENNVRVGRLHVGPVSEAWADAADEVGFMFSVEGIWPWLMLKKGNIPAENLLEAWRNDWASLVKKYRNHPGIGLWTVNNEMKFSIFDAGNKEILLKKWTIVSDMIKRMREIDPTRPIVADSGYVRKEGSYQDYLDVVKANKLDDGDFDDIHRYYGWYNESFMHYINGNFARHMALPDRPFISQEMSTGYCNEDDGLPSRVYLFNHCTPQALIGDYAFEHNDPNYFLTRQSFMTKSLGEIFRRRNHDNVAGILHFGYVTWYKDSHFADSIEPRKGVKNLKKLLSPVLISLELFSQHYYAGRTYIRDLYVVNDSEDFKAIPETTATWKIVGNGVELSNGSAEFKSIPYYDVAKLPVEIKMPKVFGRVDAKLQLTLTTKDGKVLSENDYDIVIANEAWSQSNIDAHSGKVAVYDPQYKYTKILDDLNCVRVENLDKMGASKVLVVADLESLIAKDAQKIALEKFIKNGGKVLLLNPGKAIMKMYGGEVSAPKKVHGRTVVEGNGLIKLFREQNGEIVTPKIPESPVFDGIKPMDMCWFAEEGSRAVPLSNTAIYQIDRTNKNVKQLAENMMIHAYLQKPSDVLAYSGAPIISIKDGKGEVIASEMRLTSAESDPIAKKLIFNMIKALF